MNPGIDYVGITTVFFCHDGKGNFLFHKRGQGCRDEQGRWDMGSGKLDHGLTLRENVLKEIEEEYGCKGVIQEELPPLDIFREHNGNKTHWLAILFFVLVDPKEVRNNEPDKMEEVKWFRLDEFPSPLHSGLQKQLSIFKDRFEKYR